MKKFFFLIPVILFLIFTMIGNRMFASGSINPTTLLIMTAALMGVFLLFRPKAAQAPKPVGDVEQKVRGEFAKNAFANDPQLGAKFQSALKDYSSNMPKSALNKLQKLAPLCKADDEIYAVAVATAMCQITVGKFVEAIRQYNKAIVLHPTSEHALAQGSCYQRLGELKKAQDAYAFALDLDSNNLDARSSLATSYVADGSYQKGLDQAMEVLARDEKNASAQATAAICHGLLGDPLMSKHYTKLAVENGYSEKKITDTISALKKR